MAQTEKIKVVTPTGTARFPWLTKPDTKFNAAGEYKTELVIDPSTKDGAEFVERLEAEADKAYQSAQAELKAKGGKHIAAAKKLTKHMPLEDDYDDNGDETGLKVIKMKSKASGTTKAGKNWERVIPLFDAAGVQVPKGSISIFGGSRLKIEVVLNPFSMPATNTAGLNLQIEAIQIIELSGGSGGGGTASSHGFGVEADGFSASSIPGADSSFNDAPSQEGQEPEQDDDF